MTPPAPVYRPQSTYEGARHRRVMTVQHLLPGNTFSGFAGPTGPKGNGQGHPDDNGNVQYLQGSRVDIAAY